MSSQVSESLDNFLTNFARPGIENSNEIDDEFVRVIKSLPAEWINDKIDIFLKIKGYYTTFYRRQIAYVESNYFQDYYEEIIVQLFNRHFEKAIKEIKDQKKTEDTNSTEQSIILQRINDFKDFIFLSFSSFASDAIYDMMVEQIRALEDDRKTMKDLNIQIADQQKNINNLQESVQNTTHIVDEQSRKVSETCITVLSVFVGVVMVFFGGFTILENAIEGMASASPFRLTFTMLLFGAILFNIVVVLFYLVSKLTQKRITCECYKFIADTTKKQTLPADNPSNSSTNDDSESNKKDIKIEKNCTNCIRRNHLVGFCRIRHILPYIYWGNAIIITLLILVFCMYSLQKIDWNIPTEILQKWNLIVLNNKEISVTLPQILISLLAACTSGLIFFLLGKPRSMKSTTKRLEKANNITNTEKNPENTSNT